MEMKHLAVALAAATLLSGCDSFAQLVVTPKESSPSAAIAATQLVTAVGATNTVSYVFAPGALPADILAGQAPALVLSGKPAPLSLGKGGTWVATLPPLTQPPVTDPAGRTVMLLQSSAGRRYLSVTVAKSAPIVIGPATASL
ncbi:hypothetical protein J7643_07840 [bacterium]|nr:hypothetical protein [bacterium]